MMNATLFFVHHSSFIIHHFFLILLILSIHVNSFSAKQWQRLT
jgi:hypothetical protein